MSHIFEQNGWKCANFDFVIYYSPVYKFSNIYKMLQNNFVALA